ncbi:MAG: hypothetical protein QOJ80_5783 [Mycobacterium sp.]|jgi:hypothetical protein|nr:hypothetical protein [Mycobacterium sp.]
MAGPVPCPFRRNRPHLRRSATADAVNTLRANTSVHAWTLVRRRCAPLGRSSRARFHRFRRCTRFASTFATSSGYATTGSNQISTQRHPMEVPASARFIRVEDNSRGTHSVVIDTSANTRTRPGTVAPRLDSRGFGHLLPEQNVDGTRFALKYDADGLVFGGRVHPQHGQSFDAVVPGKPHVRSTGPPAPHVGGKCVRAGTRYPVSDRDTGVRGRAGRPRPRVRSTAPPAV